MNADDLLSRFDGREREILADAVGRGYVRDGGPKTLREAAASGDWKDWTVLTLPARRRYAAWMVAQFRCPVIRREDETGVCRVFTDFDVLGQLNDEPAPCSWLLPYRPAARQAGQRSDGPGPGPRVSPRLQEAREFLTREDFAPPYTRVGGLREGWVVTVQVDCVGHPCVPLAQADLVATWMADWSAETLEWRMTNPWLRGLPYFDELLAKRLAAAEAARRAREKAAPIRRGDSPHLSLPPPTVIRGPRPRP